MTSHLSLKSRRNRPSRHTQNTQIEENFNSILLTPSPITQTSSIAQLQRVIGNKATRILLQAGAAVQREPVQTTYGVYDSDVLKQQQACVENLIDKTHVIDGVVGEEYIESQNFRIWTKAAFPESQQTPRRKRRDQQHYQGWKVHYGVKPDQAAELVGLILPIAQKYEIVHKIVAQLETYAKDTDPNQLGKYITLYPESIQQMFEIVEEIETALTRLNIRRLEAQEKTKAEYELGTSGLATTRYGSFTGNEVYVPTEEGGKHIHDDRTQAYPPQLQEEFKSVVALNHELVERLLTIQGALDQGGTPSDITHTSSSSSSSGLIGIDHHESQAASNSSSSSSGLGESRSHQSQAASSSSDVARRPKKSRPKGIRLDANTIQSGLEKEEKKTYRHAKRFGSPPSYEE